MSGKMIGLLVILLFIAIAMIWGGPGKGWIRKMWNKKHSDTQ